MRSRAATYCALLLILSGLYLLAVTLAGAYLRLGWGQLWPGLLLLAAMIFYLPILVWWPLRAMLSILAVPGSMLLVNALLFFYNALAHDWDAWAYLWTLEFVGLALGLFLTWLAEMRRRPLLLAAAILAGVGVLLFSILGTILGGSVARLLAPIVLIGFGLLLLIPGLLRKTRENQQALA